MSKKKSNQNEQEYEIANLQIKSYTKENNISECLFPSVEKKVPQKKILHQSKFKPGS